MMNRRPNQVSTNPISKRRVSPHNGMTDHCAVLGEFPRGMDTIDGFQPAKGAKSCAPQRSALFGITPESACRYWCCANCKLKFGSVAAYPGYECCKKCRCECPGEGAYPATPAPKACAADCPASPASGLCPSTGMPIAAPACGHR